MTQNPAEPSQSDARRAAEASLKCFIGHLLRESLGAIPKGVSAIFAGVSESISPLGFGLLAGISFAALFCGLPEIVFHPPEPHLLWLSAFGALYFTFAVTSARYASYKVSRTIEDKILPQLSLASILDVEDQLRQRFPEMRVALVGYSIALTGTFVAALAIFNDLKKVSLSNSLLSQLPDDILLQTGCWSAGWFVLFLTAVRTTDVSRFYYEFSRSLSKNREKLSTLSPGTTPVVRDTASLGRIMLAFWLGIFVIIIAMVPALALADPERGKGFIAALRKAIEFRFVLLIMPITMFFSGVFGTSFFLKSESAIREAVGQRTRESLTWLDQQIEDVLENGDLGEDATGRRMDRLIALRAGLLRDGQYTSFIASGLSLVVPILGLLVPIVSALIGRH